MIYKSSDLLYFRPPKSHSRMGVRRSVNKSVMTEVHDPDSPLSKGKSFTQSKDEIMLIEVQHGQHTATSFSRIIDSSPIVVLVPIDLITVSHASCLLPNSKARFLDEAQERW